MPSRSYTSRKLTPATATSTSSWRGPGEGVSRSASSSTSGSAVSRHHDCAHSTLPSLLDARDPLRGYRGNACDGSSGSPDRNGSRTSQSRARSRSTAACRGTRRRGSFRAAALASELGLERLYVKDESRRFGLPAFKFLGASWAIARLLGGGSDAGDPRARREVAGDRPPRHGDRWQPRSCGRAHGRAGRARIHDLRSERDAARTARGDRRRGSRARRGRRRLRRGGAPGDRGCSRGSGLPRRQRCRPGRHERRRALGDRRVLDAVRRDRRTAPRRRRDRRRAPADRRRRVRRRRGALGCPAGRHRDRRRPRRGALHRRIARGGTARHGRDDRDVDGRTRRGNTVGGRVADPRRRARGRDRRR